MPVESLKATRAQTAFSIGVGGLLIVAALLKCEQLVYHEMPSTRLLNSVALYILLVVAEFVLGLWLWTGLYWGATRLVTMVVFFGFMQAALWQALTGQASCACLGPVAVNPWYAVVVDLAILGGLLLFGTSGQPRTIGTHRMAFYGFLLAALTVGAPGVMTMAYRREEADMSGYAHELAAAKKEGVRLEFRLMPMAVEGTDRVTGMSFQGVAPGPVDASGRATLIPVAGGSVTLPAELVVVATGQEKLETLIKAMPNVGFAKGRVVVDDKTGQTGNPKVFAGGDCANGAKEVVNAAAEGKRAALGMNSFFHSTSQRQEIQVTIK